MRNAPQSTKSCRAFVDALRECLGLEPLYRKQRDPKMKFAEKFTRVSHGRQRGRFWQSGEGFDIYTGGGVG